MKVIDMLGSGHYHLKAWGSGITTLCCNGPGFPRGTAPKTTAAIVKVGVTAAGLDSLLFSKLGIRGLV